MAIEQLRQDNLSDEGGEIVYLITDAASTAAAKATLLSTAPTTFDGLPIRTKACTVVEEEETEQAYIGRAVYGTNGSGSVAADLQVGDSRILFSSLGGSTRISNSLATVNSYGDAEDHDGAIGVDADGNVEGTDIFTGGLDITVVSIVASNTLTTAYLSQLLSLTTPNPHKNNATFSHTDTEGRGFSVSAGEMLYLGFSSSPRGNGEDEVRHEFKGSKNLTGLSVGGITGIAKNGWDHLWVKYKQDVDAVADKIVSVPASVYVEKVYQDGDFSVISL